MSANHWQQNFIPAAAAMAAPSAYATSYMMTKGTVEAFWICLGQIPTCGLSLVGIFLLFSLHDEIHSNPYASPPDREQAHKVKDIAIFLLMLCIGLSIVFPLVILNAEANKLSSITTHLLTLAAALGAMSIYATGWRLTAKIRAGLGQQARQRNRVIQY
jgi:Kef-type K+ transport system membrane component KefB